MEERRKVDRRQGGRREEDRKPEIDKTLKKALEISMRTYIITVCIFGVAILIGIFVIIANFKANQIIFNEEELDYMEYVEDMNDIEEMNDVENMEVLDE